VATGQLISIAYWLFAVQGSNFFPLEWMVGWLDGWIFGLLDYWIFGLGLNVYGLRIVVRRNGSRVWGPRCNRTLVKVLDTFSASAVAPSENTRTDIWIFG
jgi:hypothetical protein